MHLVPLGRNTSMCESIVEEKGEFVRDVACAAYPFYSANPGALLCLTLEA